MIADLDEVTSRLDSWDNMERPIDLTPRMDTAIPNEVRGVRFSDDINTRSALGELTVDELARKADPDLFRVYDELAAKRDQLREALRVTKPDDTEWARMITEANNKVQDLTDAVGDRKLKPKQRAELTKQRDAAIATRDELMAQPRTADTPRQTAMREQLQKADYKMRDLAPAMTRAYTRARGTFATDAKTKAAVKRMIDERSPRLAESDVASLLDKAQRDTSVPKPPGAARLSETPIAARVDPADIEPGKPFVEAARKVVEKDAKAAQESLDVFRSSLDSMLKDDKVKDITIGNHTFNLKDSIEVPNADGTGSRTITIREMLEEMNETDADLKAMEVCSM